MTGRADTDVIDVDNTTRAKIKVVMGRASNEQIWVLEIDSAPSFRRMVTLSSEKGLRIHRGKATVIGAQSEDDYLTGRQLAEANRGQIRVGLRMVYQREGSVLKELCPNMVTAIRLE